MFHKRCIAVFVIVLFSLSVQSAQERKKQLTKEQKEAARLERRERRLQLISYLDGIGQKAATVDPVEDRIRVLTEVADAYWFLDKTRATASFTQVFQSIDTIATEPGADNTKFNSLSQSTLARIARRDPELAAKLASNATDRPPRDADRYMRELNAEGTPFADTLITVAFSLLKTDLQQSVALARVALRDGMSQLARLYLVQLRAIDRPTADSLIELSLKHAATRNPAPLFDVLCFWEYAFQPGGFHFGAVSWPGDEEKRPSYAVSQSLKQSVLQFAITAISQNIQLRLSTNDTPARLSGMRIEQLYSVIQQLLPPIADYAPQAADTLRAELAVLEQSIRGAGHTLPGLKSFGPSTERTNSAVESVLNRAESMGFGKQRDELYLAAAYRLLFDNQFEKAASLASRIDDIEMKNSITDAINFNWAGSMLSSGNTAGALTLARTIRTLEPKLVALAKIGGVLATKGDTDVAEELFNESQTLATKATPSAIVSAAVLNIALIRAGTQRDAAKAFEALSFAVSLINKANSDTVNWQVLNSQSSTMALKTAGLSAIPSGSGGFKSIRVTYPRLAGLSEVFAESSKHDLHQTIGVAQELSSKALSLSLQAAVCRSAAERLAQEETTR